VSSECFLACGPASLLFQSSPLPQLAGRLERVDPSFFPPSRFISDAVNQPMMDAAEWDRELVARLAPKGTRLREA
jgi:hypothetical protein